MELKEVLQQLEIGTAPPGHDHNRPGWLNTDCPWCSPGWSHYRLGFNLRYNYCNCWSCGRHDIAAALVELSGKTYREINHLLKDVDRSIQVEKVKRGKLNIPDFVEPLQDCHKNYLKKRGFNWKELVKLWEIKGIGLSHELSWRIFIPIIQNGSMVSWTTRSISDEHEGRYVSAGPSRESVNHKDTLYGLDYCRHAVILCEGPTDVWAIGPGAVCSFGTGYSVGQIERLSTYPVRVVCSDNERTAQKTAAAICRNLEVFPGETYNIRLSCKDPAECLKKCPSELVHIREHFLER
jgi:hypothetical protein